MSVSSLSTSVSVIMGIRPPPHITFPSADLGNGSFRVHIHNGRLHREDGPAVEGPPSQWWWRGVQVTEIVVIAPDQITAEMLLIERNQEVRRIMLERMGLERFVRQSGTTKRGADRYGVLWMQNSPYDANDIIQIVEVINSTSETDGTFRHYFLRVPPTIRTPHEGVAWSFGKTVEQYDPLHQS